jgi:hypothetical protein
MAAEPTDFEAMQFLFQKRGISYEVDGPPHTADGWRTITVEGGYAGFYTNFTFDETGALKSVDAFE